MLTVNHRRHIQTALAAIVLAGVPFLLWGQGDSVFVADSSGVHSGGNIVAADTAVTDTAASDTAVAAAQPTEFVYDSSTFTPRTISAAELATYREQSDFDYARTVAPSKSFLDRILGWLSRLLGPILGNDTGRFLFQYGIFGTALVLVIILLVRSELGGIFKRAIGKKKGTVEFEEIEEDLSRMDFDTLIAEAVDAGNLRRAVRLHYLKLLREMSERGLIEWRREKTNSDYLYELKRQDLYSSFAELTRVFDYVWYGWIEIDADHYARIRDSFGTFIGSVNSVKGGA